MMTCALVCLTLQALDLKEGMYGLMIQPMICEPTPDHEQEPAVSRTLLYFSLIGQHPKDPENKTAMFIDQFFFFFKLNET